MFLCSKLKMFGRLSEVLQTAADVLAPPPSALQDFEYHWKIIKQFYNIERDLPRIHLNDTNIPNHLEQMLQILIKEENETDAQTTEELAGKPKQHQECLNYLLNINLLDILVELGVSDTPPGARVIILNFLRRFLSCLKDPPIDHSNVFQPIQKLVQLCNGKIASPYESEEILFLEAVAGLVRKNPNLVHLFLPFHQHSAFVTSNIIKKSSVNKIPVKNTLFECSKVESSVRRISLIHDETRKDEENTVDVDAAILESTEGNTTACDKINSFVCDCEEGERLFLLDVILSYFESPDSVVIVRACEGALILSSLSSIDTNCSAVQTSFKSLAYHVVDKVTELCKRIPEDMDLGDIDEAIVSWGLIPRDPETEHFVGRYQLFEFLCWLDYCDCLCRECPSLELYIGELLRKKLLEDVIEPGMLDIHAAFTTVLAAKIVRQLNSNRLYNEIANWLVGEKAINELNGGDSLITIILENAQDNPDLIFQTLQFVESLLDVPHERVLHGMIFYYINSRGYYDPASQKVQSWSDEEEEREKRRGSADGPIKSRTLAPNNILKIINNFLLLLPRQIVGEGGGTCYEEYVQDASRHYQSWIKRTETFNWPIEAVFPEPEESHHESLSPSSLGSIKKLPNSRNRDFQCTDSGISEESFYEGPLLRLLFNHVQNMTTQQYELNLAAIAILSKLAMLPHPYLHEILLSPEIPVASGAKTLWSVMQNLAKQLLLEIPRHENFQQKIKDTGKRLLTNPPMLGEDGGDAVENESLFESIIVLEEFCKELAAIAFVKYHHATE